MITILLKNVRMGAAGKSVCLVNNIQSLFKFHSWTSEKKKKTSSKGVTNAFSSVAASLFKSGPRWYVKNMMELASRTGAAMGYGLLRFGAWTLWQVKLVSTLTEMSSNCHYFSGKKTGKIQDLLQIYSIVHIFVILSTILDNTIIFY